LRPTRRQPFDFFPYRLVLPVLAIEAAFVLVPLGIALYYSLHRVRFFNVGAFVGWDNYWSALTSPTVLHSAGVTVAFTLFSLALAFATGFALALHLERDGRVHTFFRAVVLVPYVISMLVGSMLLKWMFAQGTGLFYLALVPMGLGDVSILSDPQGAMAAMVYNAVWRDSAFAMILLMAGLKSIPPQIHAAALVDGATGFYRFRRITLPLLRVPILITLVRLMLHFANILTFPLVLTGGGPVDATETIGLKTFRLGFEDYLLGRANAVALLMFVFNVVLVMVLIRLFRENRRLA